MKIVKHLYISLFLCLSLFSAAHCSAATAFFKQYDVSNGLFNNQARCVIEMPDHRMLVQTEGMFNLYDGRSFKELEYDRTKTVSVQSFINVNSYFDRQHRLWVKDFHNLYVIDTRNYKFLSPSDFLKASRIKVELENFFIDTDGNAWLMTVDYKLYFYDFKHPARLILRLPKPSTRADHVVVTDVVKLGNRYHLFMSNGILACLDGSRTRMLYRQRVETKTNGFRLHARILNSNTLLVRKCAGLYKFDVRTRRMQLVIGPNVSEFHCCKNGEVWASCDSGLIHLDKHLRLVSRINVIKESKLGKRIKDSWLGITVDHQGGVWLCSFNNGVMYYNPRAAMTSLYRNASANTAESNSLHSIVRYNDNMLFALSYNGLYVFDRRTHAFTSVGGMLGDVKGKSMIKDSKGYLWIATGNKGIICYHPLTGEVHKYGSAADKTGTDFNFCEEVGDGIYLVCYARNRLALFCPATNRYHLISDKYQKLYDYRCMVCACRVRGGFIIGTQNGLFFYDVRRDVADFKRFAALDGNKYSNKCNCIITDRQGRVWVGTQNGLLCYDEGRRMLRRYSSADGLPNSCIQSMTQDSNGNLWITTTNGMAKMRTDGNRVRILTLDKQDGIFECCFNERSLCAAAGMLYFGTTNGVCEVDLQKVKFPRMMLTPCVTDLFVHSNEMSRNGLENNMNITDRITADREVHLNYDENFITIGISALNYLFPSHTIYRYQLKDIDPHPICVSGRDGKISVSYTSLSPGDYRFVVQAAMYGQSWGKPVTIRIHIAPPFWLSWWAILIYVLVTAGIILYVLNVYIRFRRSKLELEQKERARLERENLDEMKFRFFTNISHEFRTPLTLIITPLQTLLARRDIPNEVARTLKVIQRSAHSLNALVTQLLDFRSLENHGETLRPTVVQVGALLSSVEKTFGEMARERGIEFSVTGNAFNVTFCLDLPKMQKIINNLLSNAFKFTHNGGSINLNADISEQQHLMLSVSDTGIGIKRDDINSIFNRFYQGDAVAPNSPLNTGSGIGLNMVKGYVELHHGTVSVDSEVGKGTRFNIDIPGNHPDAQAEDDVDDKTSVTAEPTGDENSIIENDSRKVSLLIVEDNPDFRNFMEDTLKDTYHIDTAGDGVETMRMLHDIEPDLIISDVMMPKMNGFQLCANVKNNFKLSHVPVILLTAENSDQGREDGYKSGADSYIIKPFNMNVLRTRICQLLEQREQRRKRFNNEVDVNPKEITITPLDEKFMSKALACVERNINNADYGVEAFSSDMAMERSNLYRKMQAIIGRTPSEFIRSIRLKRAAQLLKTKEYSVLDVSVMVGFNTMKYFTRHFKEEFGVTPSQYR